MLRAAVYKGRGEDANEAGPLPRAHAQPAQIPLQLEFEKLDQPKQDDKAQWDGQTLYKSIRLQNKKRCWYFLSNKVGIIWMF